MRPTHSFTTNIPRAPPKLQAAMISSRITQALLLKLIGASISSKSIRFQLRVRLPAPHRPRARFPNQSPQAQAVRCLPHHVTWISQLLEPMLPRLAALCNPLRRISYQLAAQPPHLPAILYSHQGYHLLRHRTYNLWVVQRQHHQESTCSLLVSHLNQRPVAHS